VESDSILDILLWGESVGFSFEMGLHVLLHIILP